MVPSGYGTWILDSLLLVCGTPVLVALVTGYVAWFALEKPLKHKFLFGALVVTSIVLALRLAVAAVRQGVLP